MRWSRSWVLSDSVVGDRPCPGIGPNFRYQTTIGEATGVTMTYSVVRIPVEAAGTLRNPAEATGTPRNPAEATGTPRNPAEATGTVAIPARRDGRSAVLLVRGRAEVDREATVAIGALAEVGRGGVLRSVAGLGLGCSLRGRLCGAGGHFLGAPVRGVLRNLVRTRKRVVLERSRMRQIVRSRVGVLPVPVAGAIDVAGTLGAVDAAEAAETTGGSRRVGTILTVGRTRGGPASPRPQGRERFEDEPRSGRSIPPQSPFERSPGQHTRPDHGQSQADEEDDGVGQDVAAVVEDGLEAADDEAVENVDRQTVLADLGDEPVAVGQPRQQRQ